MKNFHKILEFNPNPPLVMHIDLNSCFATIEQQANPLLRGKPIAVCAYTTPSGCILAPSVEAKRYGVKTGMRVKDGKKLCPFLILMESDPDKYRYVHMELRRLLSKYTNNFYPKSIDEFVLHMDGFLSIQDKTMKEIGMEIKDRIKEEIGDWLTVSIGIGPNRFLAKLASNLKKPDGLEEINKDNYLGIYMSQTLRDLHGINFRYEKRLKRVGICDPLDLFNADMALLDSAFKSVSSLYWYVRMRGWEIDGVEFGRRTYGNSYALPSSSGRQEELFPILSKLVEKTAHRMRRGGFNARGVGLFLSFRDGSFWHKTKQLEYDIFESIDIFLQAKRLLSLCPEMKPIRVLAVNVFSLSSQKSLQLDFFQNRVKRKKLVESIDNINEKWGDFCVTPAQFLKLETKIVDRISFGGVNEL